MKKLQEFADIIRKELIIRRYPNQANRWTCQFENSNIKGDGVLIGTYGNGNTPAKAMKDYDSKIRGQVLIFDGNTENEREFVYVN